MSDLDEHAGRDGEQVYAFADGGCFGCGQENPIGLRLRFEATGDGVCAVFTADRRYQGYAGLLHGGLAATILDEALAWAILKKYGLAVTGELYMRHRHPVPVGEPLVVSGRVVRRRQKLVEAEARIADGNGKTLAEGRGKFMLVKQPGDMV